MSLTKVMFFFAIFLSSMLLWATSNVCRYNFVIDKKTNELNILMQEIGPSIGSAKAFYFKELNCSKGSINYHLSE